MRLVRVRHEGVARYGVVEAEQVRLIDGLPEIGSPAPTGGQLVPYDESALLVPVEPTKVVAIGRNYAAHASEMGLALGGPPSVFIKPLQTLVAHGGDVVLPPTQLSSHVEHEGELVVVIGRRARNVPAARAADYVLGFTCADDVSARDIQKTDPQITRAKGFDTFCPLGPWIETDVKVDEDLDVTCTVNGELRQSGNSRDMIFSIPVLIESLSAWTTLEPGDVILTGSPSGTGPLAPGDTVAIGVEGVGILRHTVSSSPA